MSNWKELEELVMKSNVDEGIHVKRLKTRNSGYKGDYEIADFYAYYKGNLFYLEVKSTKGKSFPISMIRPTQAAGLYEASKNEGVHGGIILGTQSNTILHYIPIQAIERQLNNKKVSFSEEELKYFKINGKDLKMSKVYDIIIEEQEGLSWNP